MDDKAKAAYERKLERLLSAADRHDASVLTSTRKLIGNMRDQLIARAAEEVSSVGKGGHPEWGWFWLPRLKNAFNRVLVDVGAQFSSDLSSYTLKSYEVGQDLADKGFGDIGIQVDGTELPQIDPEQLKIASGFSADLITGMTTRQIETLNREISTHISLGDPQSLLLNLSVPVDRGVWRTVAYASEIIARTETARVQELGRKQRTQQFARKFPEVTFYQQFLSAEILQWPCKECAQYTNMVWTVDGRPHLPPDGPPMPDVPIHPNCRCTFTPWIPGLSEEPILIPYQKAHQPAPDRAKARWDSSLEGWNVVFPDGSKLVVRQPVNVPPADLEKEIDRLATAQGSDYKELEVFK